MERFRWVFRIAIFFFLSCSLLAQQKLEKANVSSIEILPIQHAGRIKPFYTFATETLQIIHGSATVKVPSILQGCHATEVIFDLWMSPESVTLHKEDDHYTWEDEPLFLVNHIDLKKKLGFDEKQKYFSYNQLHQNQHLQKLFTTSAANRDKSLEQAVEQVKKKLNLFEDLLSGKIFRIIPRDHVWMTIPESASFLSKEQSEILQKKFEKIQSSYLENSLSSQDAESLVYLGRELINPAFSPAQEAMLIETFYMKYHPFRLAWMAYLLAWVALVASSIWLRKTGYTFGWMLVAVGFILQSIGFACRIYISGRPPVTNMYESIIWVAFGTIFFSIVFEAVYRSRIFLLAATPIAVLSLILADSQPTILDPAIHPLVPVLRSNFWLTTHVLTITLSYAAFALALGVGHMILFQVCFGKKPSESIYTYLYRTLQIGLLLLASGTILGAVWANYSWGRFWDWDPKETWALIALLCYLVVLHGRLLGWWNGFGLAMGSILCFMAIIMAWYGVNFVLGQGLHSYGFGTGGRGVVFTYVGIELLFVLFALGRYLRLRNKNFS